VADTADADAPLSIRQRAGPQGNGFSVSNSKYGAQSLTIGPEGQMQIEIDRMTMLEFANVLSSVLDKPVVDKTGLPGRFQLSLEVALADIAHMGGSGGLTIGGGIPAGAAPAGGGPGMLAPTAMNSDGGTVFSSVQKLGLKLDSGKEAIEILVVDHIEKNPAEN